MISILNEFIKEMDSLKLYIDFQNDSYKNQSKIESLNQNSKYKSLPISKIKQFDFNSHIISIYGSFEYFVEQITSKYLTDVCSLIMNFSDLPKEIQDNNLQKNLDIIRQLDYRKHKNLKPEKLIEILHKNINENSSILNIEAFKNHSANFRISVLEQYFSEIGIKSLSSILRQYNPFNDYLKLHISDYASKKSAIVFSILEHLCDLRNDIAHGVNNIQLLNKSILFEYIEFMKLLSESIFECINDNYNKLLFSKLTYSIDVIETFNNSIICFNNNERVINKDTKILVETTNSFPRYFIADVIDIQHNGNSILTTSIDDSIDIGIKVSKRIKASMKFKLVE